MHAAGLVRRLALPVLLAAPLCTLAQWTPLAKDGLHDPASRAIGQLQEPAQALGSLPRDQAGNMVRWVEALELGLINPRTNILPETKVEVRDDVVIVSKFGSMPAVAFPHRAHTIWLDCSNCHDRLFKAQAGANKFSMPRILQGEQCGVCHGAVAFPLTECTRCHSVSNRALARMLKEKEAKKDRHAPR